MSRIRQSRTLLAVVMSLVMTLSLGIPVAADLNLVAGDRGHVAYTAGDGVNVRDYPGFSGAVFTALEEGVQVAIVDGPLWSDDGNAWYLVGVERWNGYIQGWVNADFISGEYVEPSAQNYTGTASSGSATVVDTNGYGLRLRDGASTSAGTIVVMPEGASVTVHSTGYIDASGMSWANISWNGSTGYASENYLSIGGGGSAAPVATDAAPQVAGISAGSYAAVSGTGGGGLNMRSEAAYYASVITVVGEGTVVTVIDGPAWDDSGNGWYLVDYSSTRGWMHGGYLAWTDQGPTSAPTTAAVAETPQQAAEPAPVAGASGVGAAVVSAAMNFIGTPYVWGGTTPGGFDCSGFTYYIYNTVAGIGLSRSLEVQASSGSYVAPDNLQPGDLVFQQNTYKWGLSHVGIYIGGGQMVNAQSERVGVAIADLWDSYWGSRYYTARRVT